MRKNRSPKKQTTDRVEQHAHLMHLFSRFIDQDSQFLTELRAFGDSFKIDNLNWEFSLPALHQFAKSQDPILEALSYTQFRQCVFAGPTHALLKERNATVAIIGELTPADDSHALSNQVDRNRYQLVLHKAEI